MIMRRYEALQARIDALSLRERALIFLALTALIYLFWNGMLMAPLEQQQRTLLGQIETLRGEVQALDEQTVALLEQHNIDPNAAERDQITRLESQLTHADRQIKEMISGLIEPQQMPKILEQILQKHDGLAFIRLENLGREALVDVTNDQRGKDEPGIFKHTMRLELEGSFMHTLAYLRELETLPWQFRWNEVELTMLEYPRAKVVITVHTLSLQEGWIGV